MAWCSCHHASASDTSSTPVDRYTSSLSDVWLGLTRAGRLSKMFPIVKSSFCKNQAKIKAEKRKVVPPQAHQLRCHLKHSQVDAGMHMIHQTCREQDLVWLKSTQLSTWPAWSSRLCGKGATLKNRLNIFSQWLVLCLVLTHCDSIQLG